MKSLTYDRESYPQLFKSCRNLAQIISWIEREGSKDDLFIAKIILNDKLLDDEEEQLLASLAASEVHVLTVEMVEIHRLVSMTMTSVIRLLQDIQVRCIETAESTDRNRGIYERSIKEIFAKSKMLIDSLEEIFALHVNEKFMLKHFSLWREAEKELSNILQLLLQAYQVKNISIVSELLGVAYPDALSNWEEVLGKEVVDNSSLSNIFNLNSQRVASDNGVDA